jgi:hypothetical protein
MISFFWASILRRICVWFPKSMYEICQNSKNETPLIFFKKKTTTLSPKFTNNASLKGEMVWISLVQFATCVVPLFKMINLTCFCWGTWTNCLDYYGCCRITCVLGSCVKNICNLCMCVCMCYYRLGLCLMIQIYTTIWSWAKSLLYGSLSLSHKFTNNFSKTWSFVCTIF